MRWLSAATLLAGLALAIGLVSPLFSPEPTVWDDAYMFGRYAHNLVTHGALSWDPRGEPTYGLTSPFFLLVVVPVRVLLTDEPLRAALLSSLVSGLAFFALLAALVRTALEPGGVARRAAIVLVWVSLAGCARMLGAHLTSGMDTTFAMAFLAGWLLLMVRGSKAWLTGVLGGLAFGVRPDLCLYTVGVPVSMAALAPDPAARRRALTLLACTAAVIVMLMGAARAYFGTPLPLPFWVKGTSYYDEYIRVLYVPVRLKMLIAFAQGCWPLLVAIAAGILVKRRTSGLGAGVLLATLAFIVYYLFFALQIMPMEARFYQPVLPALVWLGCRGLVEAYRARPRVVERIAPLLLLAALIAAAVPAARTLRTVAHGGGHLAPLTIHESYRALERDWFGLESFSRLPDDLVIATTEVGHVAALNPGKSILDLSGLNDNDLVLRRTPARELLRRRRPDLIYVPHEDYQRLREEILEDPAFASGYEYFPPAERYWLGVAVRRSSAHHAALRAIMAGIPTAPGGPARPRRGRRRRAKASLRYRASRSSNGTCPAARARCARDAAGRRCPRGAADHRR